MYHDGLKNIKTNSPLLYYTTCYVKDWNSMVTRSYGFNSSRRDAHE